MKKRKTRQQRLMEEERKTLKLLQRVGAPRITGRKRLSGLPEFLPDLSTSRAGVVKTSDRVPTGSSARRDIMFDHKWKKDTPENSQTIQEIQDKAGRIRPAYNKGGYMYTPYRKEEEQAVN